MRKKAQSGMNAAVLVAIIAVLIVIYIIFLPSEERLGMIGENKTSGGSSFSSNEKILLEDNEVIMEYIGEDEIEHDLPSINLYTSTAAEKIVEENSIYVKNGLFDKQFKEIEFKINDPENTENALISFFAKKATGRLKISINNYVIFDSQLEKVNVEPIKISNDYLAGTNTLKLEVSGVGAAFWKTNEYLIENFKITADYTDTSTRASEVSFVIAASEAKNLEKARLRFVPDCQPNKVGILEIDINGHTIFSSVPDCGNPRPLDFSPLHILTGENTLSFRTEKGRYLIDQIRVTTELSDEPSYLYYFDIDSDEFEDISDENKAVNLTFFFTDDRETKEAELIINSRRTYMTRHRENEWSYDISRYIEEGSNSLKIFPEKRLEVRKLEVKLSDN